MRAKARTLMQSLDALVWWSKASDMVQRDMSGNTDERRNRPMRWLPLLPMALGAGLIFVALASPLPHMAYGVAAPLMAVASAIVINGPLGKSSLDEDEAEHMLRKNSYFFCMAVLAFLNIFGAPALLLSAAFQAWSVDRIAGLAFALFIGNMTWFVSLPTLYASWQAEAAS